MQTFLAHSCFKKSASVLDDARLRNQRNECKVILRTITGEIEGWKNHPAVKMWVGHPLTLCEYALAICHECVDRGFAEGLLRYFQDAHYLNQTGGDELNPWWIGIEDFHASHRSNLLRKDPEHYRQFGWEEPDDLPYWWPSNQGSNRG